MRALLFAVGSLAALLVAGTLALAGVTFVSRTIQLRSVAQAGGAATARYASGLMDVGFSIRVTATERGVQLPNRPATESGARVQVSFTNTSRNQQRADRHDFSLVDASGRSQQPFTGGTLCPAWPMTDLHASLNDGQPSRDGEADQVGPSFGPVPLCFPVAGDPNADLTLVWDPDVSIAFLSSPVELLLPGVQPAS